LEFLKEVEKHTFTMSIVGWSSRIIPNGKKAFPNGKMIVAGSVPMTRRSSALKKMVDKQGASAKRK
jgi:hypothetical protein